MAGKVVSLEEAVRRFVPDGGTVVLGTAMEALIPFQAGYEMVRQGREGLRLVGPISDVLFDVLIGAGCVEEVEAAWVGNVQMGSAYAFRRAVESGRLRVADHSNFTICLALLAGSLGVPFLPARTALGSDLPSRNTGLAPFECPLTGDRLLAVRAIRPHVAVVAGQRADEDGNLQVWGNLGITREAAEASERVIALVEEVVDREVVRSDPNRTLVPGFRVDAVVEIPLGCHPSPVQGCWRRDHEFFAGYHRATRTEEGTRRWLQEWVLGCPDMDAYRDRLGAPRIEALRPRTSAPAAPVDYGS